MWKMQNTISRIERILIMASIQLSITNEMLSMIRMHIKEQVRRNTRVHVTEYTYTHTLVVACCETRALARAHFNLNGECINFVRWAQVCG